MQRMSYTENYFFWLTIMIVLGLVVLGVIEARGDDNTSQYRDRTSSSCSYAKAAVESGGMTVQEYYDMGCS